jgi:hypothetical protein
MPPVVPEDDEEEEDDDEPADAARITEPEAFADTIRPTPPTVKMRSSRFAVATEASAAVAPPGSRNTATMTATTITAAPTAAGRRGKRVSAVLTLSLPRSHVEVPSQFRNCQWAFRPRK